MNLPFHIQQAVDLGLLTAEDGKIVSCDKDAVETVLGTARLIEKLQPTTTAQLEDTTTQEAIILCRVLSSPSGKAREYWSDLRVAFGIGHGQTLPESLWSTDVFRAIGAEIDLTFLGERNAKIISRDSLISQYEELAPNRRVGFQDFAKTVSELSNPETMNSYGDGHSEWTVALDLLRQFRVRSLYKETLHMADQVARSDSKLEKSIEFLQSRAMECLGMLRGSIGQQGNFTEIIDDLLRDDGNGFLDKLMNSRQMEQPISTGVRALDLDMEGGVYRPGPVANGGRLFTLAARTGQGKTQLGVHIVANVVCGGLTAGFISAELDKNSIYARIWSAITHKTLGLNQSVFSGKITAPPPAEKESIGSRLMMAASAIQEAGGKLLIEDPWGADVDAVINTMRSMKAKNPELRLVVLDHFHCLARHRNAPNNESSMMEERAYKLMTVAKELDIDLIALAQMNRVGMDALSKKQAPSLDQIRGTDALAHVSHAVWIVRREEVPEEERSYSGSQPPRLELWHSKVRGRQAVWNSSTSSVDGIGSFLEKSVIEIHHATSTVIFDDTPFGAS